MAAHPDPGASAGPASIGIDELESRVGDVLGVSAWHRIGRRRVEAFADATRGRARTGAEADAVAQQFLVLSLLPAFAAEVYSVTGARTRVNYGLARVRFPAPVPVGARLRDRITLIAAERLDHGVRATTRNEVEIERGDALACIAVAITLLVRGEASA